jgi:hypothetical protein
MANPLLRPNDPRFQRPSVRDAGGKNPFADATTEEDPAAAEGDVYAPPDAADARPFLPQYEAQQKPRTKVLVILSLLGWAGVGVGLVEVAGVSLGWICPLLAIVPGAAAWIIAREDLKAIDAGAIDQSLASRIQLLFWLALMAFVLCVTIVAALVYRQVNFLPDF